MSLRCEKNGRLARFFVENQVAIATKFAELSTIIPRWRLGYREAVESGDLDPYAAAEFQVYPQYLQKAFSFGDGVWLELYAGEKLKQGHAVDGDFTKAKHLLLTVFDQESAFLISAAQAQGLDKEL